MKGDIYMEQKECKAIVRNGDRFFVAMWLECYSLVGHLGGGVVEIDPLDTCHLTCFNTEGKEVLFDGLDDVPRPLTHVTSEEFNEWYKAKKAAAGITEHARISDLAVAATSKQAVSKKADLEQAAAAIARRPEGL